MYRTMGGHLCEFRENVILENQMPGFQLHPQTARETNVEHHESTPIILSSA